MRKQLLSSPKWTRNWLLVLLALLLTTFQLSFYFQGNTVSHAAALPTKQWRLSPPRSDFQSPPMQCASLIHNPRPYPRKTCNRTTTTLESGDFRCADGNPAMFSQYHQDYLLYNYHFRHLKRPGNYLDIAANEAAYISNTYFFDRCLGWGGICVEGNPKYYEKIHRLRSCSLLPTCVGQKDGENVEFILHSGAGGIDSTNKNLHIWDKRNEKQQKLKLRCTTVERALNRYPSPRTIDYMSLDVEGHELPVLQGINWSTTKINVINIEVSALTKRSIVEFMESVGYKLLKRLPDGRKVSRLSYLEAIFLAPGVVFGNPV